MPPPSLFIALRTRFASNGDLILICLSKFVWQHGMEDLKTLASEAIESFIDQLSPSELVQEACSVSVSQ